MIEAIKDIFSNAAFWGLVIPLLSGVGAWYANESSKRKWESYKRREERYLNLLKYLDGFYISTHSKDLKHAFISELRLCWLYAPDNVIKAANNFLIGLRDNSTVPDEQKLLYASGLIVEIRKDLKSTSTKLNAEDFLHWSAK